MVHEGETTQIIISTHAPAGGATGNESVRRRIYNQFLLTPLREGRRTSSRRHGRSSVFLLTPLREGRPRALGRASAAKYFYSRPCGRGDQHYCIREKCEKAYFYSRPCGRGDMGELANAYKYLRISTHAPAGGATGRPPCFPASLLISTHAPAGGATNLGVFGIAPDADFYSRPCGRGDLLQYLA